MMPNLSSVPHQLYDTDYNLWVLETVKKLKSKDFSGLDWENLVEEVLDLSQREKNKLESLLIKLFEHLLKLAYWSGEVERNKAHWEAEIINFRLQIKRLLKRSPSLKSFAQEILEECYQDSRKIISKRIQLPMDVFPNQPIARLEELLDENWYP
jgi:hypothetical protein